MPLLPESTRLLMLKDDGAVLVHADAGGYKPLNRSLSYAPMAAPRFDDVDALGPRRDANKGSDRA